jgi:hypothetical protein
LDVHAFFWAHVAFRSWYLSPDDMFFLDVVQQVIVEYGEFLNTTRHAS